MSIWVNGFIYYLNNYANTLRKRRKNVFEWFGRSKIYIYIIEWTIPIRVVLQINSDTFTFQKYEEIFFFFKCHDSHERINELNNNLIEIENNEYIDIYVHTLHTNTRPHWVCGFELNASMFANEYY